jgi:hypothetical protein
LESCDTCGEEGAQKKCSACQSADYCNQVREYILYHFQPAYRCYQATEYMSAKEKAQEAQYVESWPNTTSAWAGWRGFDTPVDRYDDGEHSLLQYTGVSFLLHSQQENTY